MSGKTPRSSNIQADRIGSLLFCPACGTLLSLPGDLDEIACEQCGRREPASCELASASAPISTASRRKCDQRLACRPTGLVLSFDRAVIFYLNPVLILDSIPSYSILKSRRQDLLSPKRLSLITSTKTSPCPGSQGRRIETEGRGSCRKSYTPHYVVFKRRAAGLLVSFKNMIIYGRTGSGKV